MARSLSSSGEPSSTPVTISEFRAGLAEMVGRVERGEEVLIARGRVPVAKLVPLRSNRTRRLGVLTEMMSEETLAALSSVLDEPLPPRDRAALEGRLTDSLGIAEQ